ncbi:hypothetical protein IC619_000050 [Hazenella sp. IB182353]|uniref:hypothetical protein n=1 Tax=Polycladospora coralii TaxID=2771432 RepID=UPI001746D5F2|nr:hypothetical protein [Polycladospora coralii]MBS7528886.1 hypothetical protein [Polycladospora coralii]
MKIRTMPYSILLPTITGINLMIIALLTVHNLIPIYESVPSFASESKPHLTTEYQLEYVDTKENATNNWKVEHYKEYRYQLNPEKGFMERTSTGNEVYLKYWTTHESDN